MVFLISGFRISGQSLTNENFHNSRTIHGIDMKLGSVPKSTQKRQKNDDDIMSTISNVIIIFTIYSQFLEIANWSNSGYMVCKTYIFITSLLSYKN